MTVHRDIDRTKQSAVNPYPAVVATRQAAWGKKRRRARYISELNFLVTVIAQETFASVFFFFFLWVFTLEPNGKQGDQSVNARCRAQDICGVVVASGVLTKASSTKFGGFLNMLDLQLSNLFFTALPQSYFFFRCSLRTNE